MTEDFSSTFGLVLLLLAGALFWLGRVADRHQKSGRGMLSDAPAVHGISAKNAAVLVAAAAVFFMFLPL